MNFQTLKLANGLTLIGEIRKSAMSAACGFFVKTGSRDEISDLSGVSHFLEHMMFKGTHKRSALDITYELGAMGAQSNAYTSSELTVYYGAVLPEFFSRKLELLCDMLRPALYEDDFTTEKKVILEEIALYEDRPSHVLFEKALKQYFGSHGAGNSVLGSYDSVSNLSRDAMLGYFSRRYSPTNMVLAASGNFDWDQFVVLADRFCSSWVDAEKSAIDPPRVNFVHPNTCANFRFDKPDIQKGYGVLIGPGVAAQSADVPESDVLNCMIGDATGSKAYWKIVDKGLADCASVENYEMDGLGLTLGYVSSDSGNLHEVLDILEGLLSDSLNFTEADLDRAKTKIRTRIVLECESSLRRLKSIGADWIYRNEYEDLESKLAKYVRVSRSSIESYIGRLSYDRFLRAVLLAP